MELEDRLRLVYAAALRAQHQSCRVQIHVGTEVQEQMKAWIKSQVTAFNWGVSTNTCWGFPIIVSERLPGDTIEVHTVTTIPS